MSSRGFFILLKILLYRFAGFAQGSGKLGEDSNNLARARYAISGFEPVRIDFKQLEQNSLWGLGGRLRHAPTLRRRVRAVE